MDNIEITVFDEINDYKEKIYFFNIRQWIFSIIIVALVVPIYIFLKDDIGEEITSYIVIAIAGVFGFVGFVKIHELPAEKILPYWFRHYFLFAKPIHYITDSEYEKMKEQKKKKHSKSKKISKSEVKDNKKIKEKKIKHNRKITDDKETIEDNKNNENELTEKLSKLTKEEQDVLLKLLGR